MSSARRFDRYVKEALDQPFAGWDFSFVKQRISESTPSWNYRQLATAQVSHATALVDLRTGGGEFLNGFTTLPACTYATEGYPPNLNVARENLQPRGVKVVAVRSDEALPLPSATFDLILNRHGSYETNELRRIAAPSGALFLTQQVGSENALGINAALHAQPKNSRVWNLETAVGALVSSGFTIRRSEQEYPGMSFKDIGALVFYLRAVPWQIPGFNVSGYRSELLAIHEQIEERGSFDVFAHRFLVAARLQ